jgi:hypothetical protein
VPQAALLGCSNRYWEAMKTSVLEVDPKRYGGLLARKLPAVIRTEEENERLIAELEQLDKRHDELTPEEREYSELRRPSAWVGHHPRPGQPASLITTLPASPACI